MAGVHLSGGVFSWPCADPEGPVEFGGRSASYFQIDWPEGAEDRGFLQPGA